MYSVGCSRRDVGLDICWEMMGRTGSEFVEKLRSEVLGLLEDHDGAVTRSSLDGFAGAHTVDGTDVAIYDDVPHVALTPLGILRFVPIYGWHSFCPPLGPLISVAAFRRSMGVIPCRSLPAGGLPRRFSRLPTPSEGLLALRALAGRGLDSNSPACRLNEGINPILSPSGTIL